MTMTTENPEIRELARTRPTYCPADRVHLERLISATAELFDAVDGELALALRSAWTRNGRHHVLAARLTLQRLRRAFAEEQAVAAAQARQAEGNR
jgi:hypothetical protein